MFKRIVLLVAIFILSLSAPVLAAEAGGGVIEGQIVNGTEGGSSVADQDVTLQTYLDDAEEGSVSTKTDAEGKFVFADLATTPGYSYQVTVNFQEADYYSERLSFGEGEITKSTKVTVYDSTTSDEAIKIAVARTFIYVGQDSLKVVEYFRVVNEGDRTYIGSREVAPDKRETLKYSLPAEADEPQIITGLMECCIYGSEGGFVDTMPVLPGSKQVAYSYLVSYGSGEYIYSQRVNHPMTEFNLLVQSESVEIASDQLVSGETVEIQGNRYQHLAGGDFAPGDVLVARLSNLPASSSNQATIIWVVVALLLLGGGFGFVYLIRKRGRLQPVRVRGSLEQRRQKLLVELAQLDDDFEDGKTPERTYRRLRAEKKAQLITLMQKPKGSQNRG